MSIAWKTPLAHLCERLFAPPRRPSPVTAQTAPAVEGEVIAPIPRPTRYDFSVPLDLVDVDTHLRERLTRTEPEPFTRRTDGAATIYETARARTTIAPGAPGETVVAIEALDHGRLAVVLAPLVESDLTGVVYLRNWDARQREWDTLLAEAATPQADTHRATHERHEEPWHVVENPNHREVARLWHRGNSHADIADAVHLEPGSVRNIVSTGRQKYGEAVFPRRKARRRCVEKPMT